MMREDACHELEVKLKKRLGEHLEQLSETFVDISRQNIGCRLFKMLRNAYKLVGCKIQLKKIHFGNSHIGVFAKICGSFLDGIEIPFSKQYPRWTRNTRSSGCPAC